MCIIQCIYTFAIDDLMPVEHVNVVDLIIAFEAWQDLHICAMYVSSPWVQLIANRQSSVQGNSFKLTQKYCFEGKDS